MATNKGNDSYVWISYADLMTVVTFAFIFLLMAFMAFNEGLKNELENERRNRGGGHGKMHGLLQAHSSLGAALESVKADISRSKDCRDVVWSVDVETTAIEARFSSARSGWFAEGDDKLTYDAQKCLHQFSVLWLSRLYGNDDIRSNLQTMVIEGHTNSRPITSESNSYLENLGLSQRRAFSAIKYIIQSVGQESFEERTLPSRRWREFETWRNKRLSATGRSYADRVTNSDGSEDFERSKRIVFKCLIRHDFGAMADVLKGS